MPAARPDPDTPWAPAPFRLVPRGKAGAQYRFRPDADGGPPLPPGVTRRLGDPRFASAVARRVLEAPGSDRVLVDDWRSLRVFGRDTGDLRRVLRLPGTTDAVAWDAAGRWVLGLVDLGGSRRRLFLWDLAHERVTQLVPELTDGVSLAVSPDGTRALVGRRRGRLSVLALPGGEVVREHEVLSPRHYVPVHAVAISPDGRRGAGWTKASWDQFTEMEHAGATLLLLDLPGGRRRARLEPGYGDADPRVGAHVSGVGTRLEFSRDSTRLRSTQDGSTRWTFCAASGELRPDDDAGFPRPPPRLVAATAPRPRWDHPLAVSPDGRWLVADDRLMDTRDGGTRVLPRGGWWRPLAAFRAGGRELVLVARSGEYEVRRVDTLAVTEAGRLLGERARFYDPGGDAPLLALAGDEDGAFLAEFRRADPREVGPRRRLGKDERGLLTAGDGDRRVTFGGERLFLRRAGSPARRELRRPRACFLDARADPAGRLVAYTRGTRLAVLDLETGEDLETLGSRGQRPTAVAFSPCGLRLAAAFSDWRIRLFDRRTRRLAAALSGHPAEVTRLAFSPDGRRLFSLGADGPLLVWDVPRVFG